VTEYVGRQPAADGQRGVADSRLNSKAWHEPVGSDMPLTSVGRSDLVWGLAQRRDLPCDASILIVDDCTLYRENLAAIFAANGAAVPTVAWDLPSLIRALDDATPSIVVLNMATRDSEMLLRAATEINPNVRVIVVGVSEDDESGIVACAEAGVAGYHTRTESLEDLLVLVRRVAAGESLCTPRVSAILLRRLSALASRRQPAVKELVLTAREAQILGMLEMGLSNRDIAARLGIAVHTVKNHVHSVLTKLGVNGRAEAAALSRTIRYTVRGHRN
jgi:DNA-binding NarL/FixJ family response regulator